MKKTEKQEEMRDMRSPCPVPLLLRLLPHQTAQRLLRSALVVTLLTLVLGAGATAPTAWAQPRASRFDPEHVDAEAASSTAAFINSIGVDTHYNYEGTQWANYPLLRARLGALGVKQIRDGSDRPAVWDEWYNDLYLPYGITVTAGFYPASFWTLSDMLARLKSHPEMVAGVEGPNEPDINPISYKGQTGVSATISFQNDLYALVKGDGVTQRMPVLSPAMAYPENAAQYAPLNAFDDENMHSYPGGKLPDDQLTTRWIPNTNKLVGAASPKPIIVTETGYHTDVRATPSCGAGQPGVSEEAQAKYLPRLLAGNFAQHIVRTFLYELIDGGGPDLCWGILRNDGSPKPGYTALQSLITLLANRSPGASAQVTPGSLSYGLSGAPGSTQRLLLQNSDGDFYLLLWNNVPVYDPQAHADQTNPPIPVTVTLDQAIRQSTVYAFDATGNLTPAPGTLVNHQLTVALSDTLSIIKLSSGAAPAAASAAPTQPTHSATATAAPTSAATAATSAPTSANGASSPSAPGKRQGTGILLGGLAVCGVALLAGGGGAFVLWRRRRRRRQVNRNELATDAWTDAIWDEDAAEQWDADGHGQAERRRSARFATVENAWRENEVPPGDDQDDQGDEVGDDRWDARDDAGYYPGHHPSDQVEARRGAADRRRAWLRRAGWQESQASWRPEPTRNDVQRWHDATRWDD